jgi:hypothetical protein
MVLPDGVEVTVPRRTERLLLPKPAMFAEPLAATVTVPLEDGVGPVQLLSTVPPPPLDPKI